MADYLEAYAKHFDRLAAPSVNVDRLWACKGARYVVDAGDPAVRGRSHIVVAIGSPTRRHACPEFVAGARFASSVQLHSSQYKNPGQLQARAVYCSLAQGIRGRASSLDSSRDRSATLAGQDGIPATFPFRIGSRCCAHPVCRSSSGSFFHRYPDCWTGTPMGRHVVHARRMISKGGPLIRVNAG